MKKLLKCKEIYCVRDFSYLSLAQLILVLLEKHFIVGSIICCIYIAYILESTFLCPHHKFCL